MSTDLFPTTEDEFLWSLYQKRRNSIYGELYPKVTAIPRGNRISPDIDLLGIQQNVSPLSNPITSAWEVKLLRYRASENDIPLDPFYAGLGQGLCYFQHGIDRVILSLGSYGAPKEQETRLVEKLTRAARLASALGPKASIGIELFTSELEGKTLLAPQQLESGVFSHSAFTHPWIDHDFTNKYDNILHRHFTWGSRWVKQMENPNLKASR
jgi:hypothetical protein